MPIFCLGVNHKTAPVEIRERLAFTESSLAVNLKTMHQLESVSEIVVLSTCNRVEIYGASHTGTDAVDCIRDFLIDHFDVAGHPVDFYRLETSEAAHHLFEVASGLDSMVLGETEIFGQVKKAYSTAHATGTTGKHLNKLFQQSFTIGKLVRSNSRIQHGSTSIGSVAVDVAERIFGDLQDCRVMIIGAGEMSRTTAQSMVSRGASGIIVSNRNYDRAVELAETLEGRAMRFDDWESALPEVDILISSTSAPHFVVKRESVERHMKSRRGSLFLIDIAVPRDIEDSIRHVNNAYLYNIDQLTQMAAAGKALREEQIVFCRDLIARHVEEKGIPALAGHATKRKDAVQTQIEANRPVTNHP